MQSPPTRGETMTPNGWKQALAARMVTIPQGAQHSSLARRPRCSASKRSAVCRLSAISIKLLLEDVLKGERKQGEEKFQRLTITGESGGIWGQAVWSSQGTDQWEGVKNKQPIFPGIYIYWCDSSRKQISYSCIRSTMWRVPKLFCWPMHKLHFTVDVLDYQKTSPIIW